MKLDLSKWESVALLVFFLAAGAYFGTTINITRSYQGTVPERDVGKGFTSPLLDCELAQPDRTPEYLTLKNELDEIIGRKKATGAVTEVSVYVRNLNNGPWLGINEKADFSPASMLKVPELMAVLWKAEREPGLLDRKLTYRGGDLNSIKNIRSEDAVKPGGTYTVRELLENMIRRSDNNAASLLLEIASIDDITTLYHEIGIPKSALDSGEALSVKTYASFYRILYNSSFLSREMSEYALRLLSESDFKEGLAASLPPGTKMAHKFGERIFLAADGGAPVLQLHECGIVYATKYPYIICVMTKGADIDNLAKTISELSLLVYDHVEEREHTH